MRITRSTHACTQRREEEKHITYVLSGALPILTNRSQNTHERRLWWELRQVCIKSRQFVIQVFSLLAYVHQPEFIKCIVSWCVLCACQHVNAPRERNMYNIFLLTCRKKNTWASMCMRPMMSWCVLHVPPCPLLFNLQPKPLSGQEDNISSECEGVPWSGIYIYPAYQSPLSSPLLWPSLNVWLTLGDTQNR